MRTYIAVLLVLGPFSPDCLAVEASPADIAKMKELIVEAYADWPDRDLTYLEKVKRMGKPGEAALLAIFRDPRKDPRLENLPWKLGAATVLIEMKSEQGTRLVRAFMKEIADIALIEDYDEREVKFGEFLGSREPVDLVGAMPDLWAELLIGLEDVALFEKMLYAGYIPNDQRVEAAMIEKNPDEFIPVVLEAIDGKEYRGRKFSGHPSLARFVVEKQSILDDKQKAQAINAIRRLQAETTNIWMKGELPELLKELGYTEETNPDVLEIQRLLKDAHIRRPEKVLTHLDEVERMGKAGEAALIEMFCDERAENFFWRLEAGILLVATGSEEGTELVKAFMDRIAEIAWVRLPTERKEALRGFLGIERFVALSGHITEIMIALQDFDLCKKMMWAGHMTRRFEDEMIQNRPGEFVSTVLDALEGKELEGRKAKGHFRGRLALLVARKIQHLLDEKQKARAVEGIGNLMAEKISRSFRKDLINHLKELGCSEQEIQEIAVEGIRKVVAKDISPSLRRGLIDLSRELGCSEEEIEEMKASRHKRPEASPARRERPMPEKAPPHVLEKPEREKPAAVLELQLPEPVPPPKQEAERDEIPDRTEAERPPWGFVAAGILGAAVIGMGIWLALRRRAKQ